MNSETIQFSVGDVVSAKSGWNASSRPKDQFPAEVKVLDVMRTRACQSGVMLKVTPKSGPERWLDSAWFILVRRS